MKFFLLAVIVEIVGIAIAGIGVGVEVATGAGLGYLLITGGSALVAAGGLLFAKVVRRR